MGEHNIESCDLKRALQPLKNKREFDDYTPPGSGTD